MVAAFAATPLTAVIDGDVIPGSAWDLYPSGQIQKVDLLLGFNVDEGYLFLRFFGATDSLVKSREQAENMARMFFMDLSLPSASIEQAVAALSPLYFDECGDDVEKLTRATSDMLAHMFEDPGIVWTAKHHSRECDCKAWKLTNVIGGGGYYAYFLYTILLAIVVQSSTARFNCLT